ncbi:hypothetical protein [Natronomonas sp.]|uniref:hypothetical protein n=1 Tax=Natronomonas sp. TaxID=2184060 RepID=UPI00398985B5
MSCDHELDAEFLHPSDADVLEIADHDGGLQVKFALACPECGHSLVLESAVESVEEGEFDLPLDDELYD